MSISKDEKMHALELHKEAIVIDFHCDAVLATLHDSAYRIGTSKLRTLYEKSNEGHVDLPRLIEGGVDCQVFSHFVEPIYNPIASRRMLQVLGYSLSAIEDSDKAEIVTRADEIIRNKDKRISIIVGFEGGEALDEDLRILNIFSRLGLRRLTLCWNNRNAIASGMMDQKSKGGLTDFGSSVVRECNKLGIIVDVSHMSDEGVWDVLDVSQEPIVASHSNCREIHSHMRNLTDDMTIALAEKGGVQGINFVPQMLTNKDNPSIEQVVDHIDHIVNITGSSDHVGLGSDYDGVPDIVSGLGDASKFPNLTMELMARGYSDTDIKKILGENFLRVIKKVWK